MAQRGDVIAFYDRFGARQDRQGWYEAPALARLLAAGRFDTADAVCEFGCGTGRLAASLLGGALPAGARYLALDASATMVELARAKLAPWAPRAEVRRTDGSLRVPAADGTHDRFLCTYVLDLLPEAEIAELLAEAARVLRPGGLLCVAGITPGPGLLAGLVSRLWSAMHRLHWRLVGNCRPIAVAPSLPPAQWRPLHREAVVAWGIASEVLVAERRGSGEA